MKKMLHFIDIGANLTDPMFRGIYNGTQKHKDDFDGMLSRAFSSGLQKIIISAGCIKDIEQSLDIVRADDRLFTTVGCHPTRCNEMRSEGLTYLDSLFRLVNENKGKVVAIGECGLDYDRLHFCDKETQLKYFEEQFILTEKTRLPMFMHCRNAASDFLDILGRNKHRMSGGVVHSFDGSVEELNSFLDLGLYIGINGCSLKSAASLNVVTHIPSDRLLIETDAPWCEVKPTHAGYKYVKTVLPFRKKEKFEENFCVKGRNEPCNIGQVLNVLSATRNENEVELAERIIRNTETLFKF